MLLAARNVNGFSLEGRKEGQENTGLQIHKGISWEAEGLIVLVRLQR